MASSLGLEAQMQQLQEMTAQAEALQGEVDVAWAASALIWRVVAAIIVFIMQVMYISVLYCTMWFCMMPDVCYRDALCGSEVCHGYGRGSVAL